MKYTNSALLGCMIIYSSITSGIDLSIKKDGHSLRIEGDTVEVDVPGGNLTVGKKPSAPAPAPVRDASNPVADVTADKLEPIVHTSASDIEFTNIRQRDLEVTVGGAGSITISGKVENLVATINGSGNLELENLVADKAIIKVNASGTANINVKRELRAEIIGSGDVRYSGNPGRVIPKISGSGTIEKN